MSRCRTSSGGVAAISSRGSGRASRRTGGSPRRACGAVRAVLGGRHVGRRRTSTRGRRGAAGCRTARPGPRSRRRIPCPSTGSGGDRLATTCSPAYRGPGWSGVEAARIRAAQPVRRDHESASSRLAVRQLDARPVRALGAQRRSPRCSGPQDAVREWTAQHPVEVRPVEGVRSAERREGAHVDDDLPCGFCIPRSGGRRCTGGADGSCRPRSRRARAARWRTA